MRETEGDFPRLETGDPPDVRFTQLNDMAAKTEWRIFRFKVQVIDDDVELISLISQCIKAYPQADHIAASAWLRSITGGL